MKYFIILLVAALIGTCAYAYNHNPQECVKLGNDLAAKWPAVQADLVAVYGPSKQYSDDSYVAALAESKRTGKNMLLIFDGSEWCPSCQFLDKEVLPTAQWHTFSGQFVVAKLEVPHDHPDDDASKTPSQRIADKFGVKGYPTLLVVDSNEKELKRSEGYSTGVGAGPLITDLQPSPQ